VPSILTAWQSYTNAHGGINGENVQVINEDVGSATSPTAGLTAAQKLIGTDHVAAIITFDSNDQDWVPYAASHHVPIIDAAGGLGNLSNPTSFQTGANAITLLVGNANVARSIGKKFGFVACVELAICSQGIAVIGALAPTMGLQIPVNTKVSATAPDYTAVCQQLKAAGVDSYGIGGPQTMIKRVVDTCYSEGLRVPVVMTFISADATVPKDPAFDGAKFIDIHQPFFASSSPGLAAYQAALHQYAPQVVGTAADNSFDLAAWAAGGLIASGAQAAGSGAVTSASLITGLYTVKNDTLDGVTAPLNFPQGQPDGGTTCYFVYSIANGAYQAGAAQPTCAPSALIAQIMAKLS
jgi:branched-chain amino acid transport system substrate-binding protein